MGRILPVFYFYGLFGPFVTPFFTATPIKQTGHQLTVESKGNKSTKHGRSDLSHRQKASVHIKISMWQYFLNGIPHPGPYKKTKYSSVPFATTFAKVFATVCVCKSVFNSVFAIAFCNTVCNSNCKNVCNSVLAFS